MKNKKLFYTILIALVAVALLIVVVLAVARPFDNDSADPHAGHDHSTGTTGHNHADAAHGKSAKDSYEVKRQENGSYIYRVVSRAGHSYTTQESYPQRPTVTEISRDVIAVSGLLSEKNNLSGWAVYYNVTGEGQVSRTFNYVLATGHSRVAYLAGQGGKFRVVVCNPFNEMEATSTDLPGLKITSTGNPEITYKVVNKNLLQVSYTVNGAEKTVTIGLN